MTTESLLFNALKGLVSNRVYPDIAPIGTVRPYLTFQQVGGASINFLGGDIPGKARARMQVNVWADTRSQAALLITQVESAIRSATALQATVLGQPVSSYELDTLLYGSRQDFDLFN